MIDLETVDRRLALPAVEAGLEILGAPLTPYQIDAAARISEPNAAGTGYRWPRVVILWPRQTGKSTLILTLALGRCRRLDDYRAAYAAQTGHITSQRFKEWTDALTRRPAWHHDYKTRSSDGTERITVRRTHSYLRAFPPIPGRLRSNALDLVIVDEAQEHDDSKVGQSLDADIVPVLDTRPRGQWIIAGTAGDLASTYWTRHYLEAAGGSPGTLLLELGTWPADADPDDPATWAAHHPGLIAGRTTLEKLHQARGTLGPERFAREYGNRWAKATASSVFPPGTWDACHTPGAGIVDGTVRIALEVHPDRAAGVLVAAGQSTAHPDRFHVEIVDELPLPMITATAARLAHKYRTPITLDPMSAAATHLDALRRARVPTRQIDHATLTTASGHLFDLVAAGGLTHLDQPPMTAAAHASTKRTIGSRWAFHRDAPGGALITAAALATWDAARAQDTGTDRGIITA